MLSTYDRIKQFTVSCQETLNEIEVCIEDSPFSLYCYPIIAKYDILSDVVHFLWRLLDNSDDHSYLISNMYDLGFYAYLAMRFYEQGAKIGLWEEKSLILAATWDFYRSEIQKVIAGKWILQGESDHE